MYPSGLTITPEPKLRSRRSRGILNRPSELSPKNCWKKGSIIGPDNWLGVRTTLDDEMFTTVGKTAFTTGAKLSLLGPSLESASFIEAGTLADGNALAEARPFAENKFLAPWTASS